LFPQSNIIKEELQMFKEELQMFKEELQMFKGLKEVN
jgi:hypothetical protein